MVCNYLGLGGSEKTLQIFCKYLDRARFDVYACGRLGGGIRVDELKKLDIPVFTGPLDLDELVTRLQIDICHVHRSGHYERGSLPTKRKGWPRIVETNVFQDYDVVENAVIDCHLFVSLFSRYRYLERFPWLAGARYETLYNPVDFEEIRHAKKEPGHVFGRCGRPDFQKWHEVYIEALPVILEKVSDARCLLKGAPEEITSGIQDTIHDGRVTLLPPTLDVAGFYRELDVFAHAARVGETFGCVIAEAMACGVPVVTLSTPQRKKANAQVELVEHGVTGLVCERPGDFANAVVELLMDQELRLRLGRASRDKALSEFEAGRLARQLETIYFELMEQRPSNTEVLANSADLSLQKKNVWRRATGFIPYAARFLLRHPTKLRQLREQWRSFHFPNT